MHTYIANITHMFFFIFYTIYSSITKIFYEKIKSGLAHRATPKGQAQHDDQVVLAHARWIMGLARLNRAGPRVT